MDHYPEIADIILAYEGGLSMVTSDPGNWTGGAVGVGRLGGTRFGISAASFPTLDIPNLTRDQALAIYRQLYWNKCSCDALPPALALLVFDAAVNNGVGRATRWLQTAVGAEADGLLGTATFKSVSLALARPNGTDALCSEYQMQRLFFMVALSTWATFGRGWARRLCRLPFQALRLSPA